LLDSKGVPTSQSKQKNIENLTNEYLQRAVANKAEEEDNKPLSVEVIQPTRDAQQVLVES
jgi:hypothetical protein